MSFGSIYSISWFGNANAANGWGSIYPFNSDGSFLLADTTLIKADTTQFKTDANEY